MTADIPQVAAKRERDALCYSMLHWSGQNLAGAVLPDVMGDALLGGPRYEVEWTTPDGRHYRGVGYEFLR